MEWNGMYFLGTMFNPDYSLEWWKNPNCTKKEGREHPVQRNNYTDVCRMPRRIRTTENIFEPGAPSRRGIQFSENKRSDCAVSIPEWVNDKINVIQTIKQDFPRFPGEKKASQGATVARAQKKTESAGRNATFPEAPLSKSAQEPLEAVKVGDTSQR
jgi:hypothetical protein